MRNAAAKLAVLVALIAALALTEVTPLLGDTWFSGGTVAVFRDSLDAAGLIMVEIDGGFAPG